MRAGEAHIEATPHRLRLRHRHSHQRCSILGHAGIGMEKQQYFTTRLRAPRSSGTPGRGRWNRRWWRRNAHFEAVVPATAIDDDQLVNRAAQRPKLAFATREERRLAEHRNDDGEPRDPESGSALYAQARPRRNCCPVPPCSRSSDCGRNRASAQVHVEQIGDVRASCSVDTQGQAQHLVEVAVVHVPLPVDADQRAAHHGVEIRRLVSFFQHAR